MMNICRTDTPGSDTSCVSNFLIVGAFYQFNICFCKEENENGSALWCDRVKQIKYIRLSPREYQCIIETKVKFIFFEGRSSGNGTFHLSMAKMKELDINVNDTESPTGLSMRIGTGNSYIEIYEEVKDTHTHKYFDVLTEMEFAMSWPDELPSELALINRRYLWIHHLLSKFCCHTTPISSIKIERLLLKYKNVQKVDVKMKD